MTNNKVIIDGVEVQDCKFYYPECGEIADCGETCNYYLEEYDGAVDCNKYPNCYYKQLKRKMQECEKLKSALEEIEEIAITDCGFCTNYKCGRMQNILCFIDKAKEQ